MAAQSPQAHLPRCSPRRGSRRFLIYACWLMRTQFQGRRALHQCMQSKHETVLDLECADLSALCLSPRKAPASWRSPNNKDEGWRSKDEEGPVSFGSIVRNG